MATVSALDVPSPVASALRKASRATGAGFDYLFRTALRESSLDPRARARTSSAAGLFQFIESTWLETVKEAGPEHGMKRYADKIRRTGDGAYIVPDAADRKKILALRFEPKTAAFMAGALTERNDAYLEARLGRDPSDPELYMAHFMGAKGAGRFIELNKTAPDARADRLFPKEARANRPIFYASGGRPRTISEVYDVLSSKHVDAAGDEGASHRNARKAAARSSGAGNDVPPQPILDFLGFFRPKPSAELPESDGAAKPKTATDTTLFHRLFARDNGGNDPARGVLGFWSHGQPLDLSPTTAALRHVSPSGLTAGGQREEVASSPLPEARPAHQPRDAGVSRRTGMRDDVNAAVSAWMRSGGSKTAGRPLDLVAAARLYGQ